MQGSAKSSQGSRLEWLQLTLKKQIQILNNVNTELEFLNSLWHLFTHRPLRCTPRACMRGGGRWGCVMWAVVRMLQLLLLLLLVLALQVVHEGIPLTFHVSFVEVGQGLQALGSSDCVAML